MPHSVPPSAVSAARPPSADQLFVCRDCPAGKRRRKQLARAVAAAGLGRRIAVIGSDCLDVCPKRGTAALLVREGRAARCAVVRAGADADTALAALLDEGVVDAVAREDRAGLG